VRRGGPPRAAQPVEPAITMASSEPPLDTSVRAAGALQSVRAICPQVEVDGFPPVCRVRGQCQTGIHELDCSERGAPCKCTTTSAATATEVIYEDRFCVGSDRPTSGQERFAAAALACGFPL
jgi:hypothetical protein